MGTQQQFTYTLALMLCFTLSTSTLRADEAANKLCLTELEGIDKDLAKQVAESIKVEKENKRIIEEDDKIIADMSKDIVTRAADAIEAVTEKDYALVKSTIANSKLKVEFSQYECSKKWKAFSSSSQASCPDQAKYRPPARCFSCASNAFLIETADQEYRCIDKVAATDSSPLVTGPNHGSYFSGSYQDPTNKTDPLFSVCSIRKQGSTVWPQGVGPVCYTKSIREIGAQGFFESGTTTKPVLAKSRTALEKAIKDEFTSAFPRRALKAPILLKASSEAEKYLSTPCYKSFFGQKPVSAKVSEEISNKKTSPAPSTSAPQINPAPSTIAPK